jgi:hypothetical protein
MKLLVGCPILKREWIIGEWLRRVEQHTPDDWHLNYVFVGSPEDPTRRVIDEVASNPVHYVDVAEDLEAETRDHAWAQKGAFARMVALRNHLLEEVRIIGPDLFLSLDSDILVHPNQITNLVDVLENDERNFAAVGGKVFLASGTGHPSWCNYSPQKGMKRSNIDYVGPVDVIMAVKLMSPAAFHVDYEYHHQGEDVGWSLACGRKGLALAHDGRVTSKHVMSRTNLNGDDLIARRDARCGF